MSPQNEIATIGPKHPHATMIGTTTIAAPATVAMAAPATYGTVSYAVPTMTTMGAPMTTMAPSFVGAPQVAQGIAVPALPVAPVKLTEGIPTPEQISSQKAGYSTALDKQLKEACDTVSKEKEMVKFNAAKQIAMFENQVDEKLTEQMALEDERATFALLELKKALVERNLQLSSQAFSLTMDYQMKSVQTEWAQKRYAFEQQYLKAENNLQADFNKQVAIANTGTAYAAPAAVA